MPDSNLCISTENPLSPTALARQHDPFWNAIQAEASSVAENDPVMESILSRSIFARRTLECALIHRLSNLLSEEQNDNRLLTEAFATVVSDEREIRQAIRDDLQAVRRHDPATSSYLTPFLNFKGFLALQAYRIAHVLWRTGRKPLAAYIQGRASQLFGVDIHPAATISRGVFIDHATGVVIGETATVGDNVVILHDVTLGATGKERGDRHPKVGNRVFIGAGAKILGNIHIGEGSTVAAGSIVLHEVPPRATVAGVPARVVRPRATGSRKQKGDTATADAVSVSLVDPSEIRSR